MLYNLMGLSPPRLLCGPAANYGSIIIIEPVIAPMGSNPISTALDSRKSVHAAWLSVRITYLMFCLFSCYLRAIEMISHLYKKKEH